MQRNMSARTTKKISSTPYSVTKRDTEIKYSVALRPEFDEFYFAASFGTVKVVPIVPISVCTHASRICDSIVQCQSRSARAVVVYATPATR